MSKFKVGDIVDFDETHDSRHSDHVRGYLKDNLGSCTNLTITRTRGTGLVDVCRGGKKIDIHTGWLKLSVIAAIEKVLAEK